MRGSTWVTHKKLKRRELPARVSVSNGRSSVLCWPLLILNVVTVVGEAEYRGEIHYWARLLA